MLKICLLAIFKNKGWLWVDAHDPDGDGVYSQSRTGMVLPFNNWSRGEPNNLNVEKCGYMNTQSSAWNNGQCWLNVPIICEYDIAWNSGIYQTVHLALRGISSHFYMIFNWMPSLRYAGISAFLTLVLATTYLSRWFLEDRSCNVLIKKVLGVQL